MTAANVSCDAEADAGDRRRSRRWLHGHPAERGLDRGGEVLGAALVVERATSLPPASISTKVGVPRTPKRVTAERSWSTDFSTNAMRSPKPSAVSKANGSICSQNVHHVPENHTSVGLPSPRGAVAAGSGAVEW